LTSRERVLYAINHEKPDRVPADIWAEPAVWTRLASDLGLKTKDEIREALYIDVRCIEPHWPDDVISGGVRQNLWGERWRFTKMAFGNDWHHVDGALSKALSFSEIESFPWPDCDMLDYSALSAQCDEYADYAVFYGNADFFERPALVRGLENFLIDTIQHPDWVHFVQKKFIDFFIEDFYRAMEATGSRIDVFLALTDLGTQSGLLLGDPTIETFIYPVLLQLSETVHRAGVKFMFHSCGSIRSIIPELITCGVDILNPIQPAAHGMVPEELKEHFGDVLAFHGGIDIQYLLPLENEISVKNETKKRVETLGADGGYILSPSHNLQADIPTENILAMYDLKLR
jgi:uroporphyrinogen decarboxylase